MALLLIAGCVVCIYRDELIVQGGRWWNGQVSQAGMRLTGKLPIVDEIRLLHLEDATADATEERYVIPVTVLNEPAMKVVARKTLTGKEAADFAGILRAVRLATDNHTSCHNPHHVVQLYHQQKKVGEMVVCFTCWNVAVPTWANWEVVNFDSTSARSEAAYAQFRQQIENAVGAHVDTHLKPK